MKTNLNISARIILLFTVAIFSTFVGDKCRDFFGDTHCEGARYEKKVINKEIVDNLVGCLEGYTRIEHEPTWHWGYRHWLYMAMCLALFVFQAINLINYINSKYNL